MTEPEKIELGEDIEDFTDGLSDEALDRKDDKSAICLGICGEEYGR